eukprot:gene22508-biopygen17745
MHSWVMGVRHILKRNSGASTRWKNATSGAARGSSCIPGGIFEIPVQDTDHGPWGICCWRVDSPLQLTAKCTKSAADTKMTESPPKTPANVGNGNTAPKAPGKLKNPPDKKFPTPPRPFLGDSLLHRESAVDGGHAFHQGWCWCVELHSQSAVDVEVLRGVPWNTEFYNCGNISHTPYVPRKLGGGPVNSVGRSSPPTPTPTTPVTGPAHAVFAHMQAQHDALLQLLDAGRALDYSKTSQKKWRCGPVKTSRRFVAAL